MGEDRRHILQDRGEARVPRGRGARGADFRRGPPPGRVAGPSRGAQVRVCDPARPCQSCLKSPLSVPQPGCTSGGKVSVFGERVESFSRRRRARDSSLGRGGPTLINNVRSGLPPRSDDRRRSRPRHLPRRRLMAASFTRASVTQPPSHCSAAWASGPARVGGHCQCGNCHLAAAAGQNVLRFVLWPGLSEAAEDSRCNGCSI